MTAPHVFDGTTISSLRAIGGLKWSLYPDKIGAFVAEMDFGIAPAITQAINANVEQGIFGYLPPKLGEDMTQACSRWMASQYGWHVPAKNIRPLADVLAGLFAAIEHFSPAGSKVIVPTPAYMPFFKIPGMCGRELIEVPMNQTADGWELDYEGLDQAFADGGGLLIMCNPHNPIGKVYSREEMLKVAEIVDRHNGRVFSDEIHAPLVYPGKRHTSYASISQLAAGHTITATAASKAWNIPGLKTAQLVLSNDADVLTWDNVGFFAEHGASNLGVVASTAAYAQGGPWLEEVLDYLDGNRLLLAELVQKNLPGVAYTKPEGTYLTLLDCRSLDLGDRPADFFSEHAGVQLVDGSDCGAAGFVRINFATPRPILSEILERMGAALAQHGSQAGVDRMLETSASQ